MQQQKANRLYLKALDHWGLEAQMLKLAEECAELCYAVLQGNSRDPDWSKIAEEMADVSIMIEQIRTLQYSEESPWAFLGQEVDKIREAKLKRLAERLAERLPDKQEMSVVTAIQCFNCKLHSDVKQFSGEEKTWSCPGCKKNFYQSALDHERKKISEDWEQSQVPINQR